MSSEQHRNARLAILIAGANISPWLLFGTTNLVEQLPAECLDPRFQHSDILDLLMRFKSHPQCFLRQVPEPGIRLHHIILCKRP